MISRVTYQGDLRTEAVHIQSGDVIVTDAPIDNNGKGEAFAPSDLVATSSFMHVNNNGHSGKKR